MSQQIIDVPVELLAAAGVASHSGADPAEGGADVGVPAGGKVDCAQSSDFNGFRVFEANQEDVSPRGGG